MIKHDVIATTANGIEALAPADFDGDQSKLATLSYSEFCMALRSLQDGEALHCRVTSEQFAELDHEYGIGE